MYSSPEYHMSEEARIYLLFSFIAVMFLWYHFRQRTKFLTGTEVALKLGIKYSEQHTRSIQPKLKFINRLQYGKDHYAFNVFSGSYKGYEIAAFDFHYIVYGPSKNAAIDPYSFFILYLPRELDEVTIYKETLFSKLKQLTRENDIDFESYEFSRKFRVRSTNPKLAYDFCNARMMEYLLESNDISLELDQNVLCMSFERSLKFEDIEKNLLRLVQIRQLMPEYLFEE